MGTSRIVSYMYSYPELIICCPANSDSLSKFVPHFCFHICPQCRRPLPSLIKQRISILDLIPHFKQSCTLRNSFRVWDNVSRYTDGLIAVY